MNETRGLWRGKRVDNKEWIEGYYFNQNEDDRIMNVSDIKKYMTKFIYSVDPSTLGKCTGLRDKNGKLIFEGDIVQYNCSIFDDIVCNSVVKIGRYKQDGSNGEYNSTECYGIFVDVFNLNYPDWIEKDWALFPQYLLQQNLLEVANKCEVIGNIFDNPELMGGELK